MATIVLNWELGAALGHISRLLSIALALTKAGHRPVMVLRDLTRAHSVLGPHGIEFLQAPIWMAPVSGLPPDLNFTETLYRVGFLDPDGIESMCRAWRSLWARLQPDLQIFEHAPTALLAARGLGVPRLVLGNSFSVPPRARPLPRYRWWTSGSGEQARLLETEQRVTRHCNEVLARLGAPAIDQVADLYDAEASLICARPGLDVYGPREQATYVNPINGMSMGVDPEWSFGESPALFAYLKPDYPLLGAVLEAIGRSQARWLVYCPGIAARLRQQHENHQVVFSARPLKMSQVVGQCHAIVCHGGGMTDIALDNGKPVLLLPVQMEQTMTSHRAQAVGAALQFPMDGNPGQLGKLVRRLIDDTELAAAARRYASAIPSADQSIAIETVTQTCERLLASR